jgi:tetratricopeptide repeat protein 27
MVEALISWFRKTLPPEISTHFTEELEAQSSEKILQLPLSKLLLGHEQTESLKDIKISDFPNWTSFVGHRFQILTRSQNLDCDGCVQETFPQLFLIGIASLNAFIQSNVTGTPLSYDPSKLLFPDSISGDIFAVQKARRDIIDSLAIDGESVYKLIPNVELFYLAKEVLCSDALIQNVKSSRWARLRVNFLHQRILSETSLTLQSSIFDDIECLEAALKNPEAESDSSDILIPFLLEKATIQIHHGLDKEARISIQEATQKRCFKFALTGILGKRTKFQQKDTSQLVVLAKSANHNSGRPEEASEAVPKKVDLNDETLLESISFSTGGSRSVPDIQDEESLSPDLKELDPENQPLLDPLDSIILLSTAASITNTSPADGLTREETLPYALRVLEGGSSNWQVYTQALLMRSRIEGYKSRTVERGLLQLQALVDQVIADTSAPTTGSEVQRPSTFLPKPTDKESAPAEERLLYVYQLASPTRWELEAELAARWVNLGGLKTALEIYERLQMWPEVALCWAGTNRDDKARQVVRRQLFHASANADETVVDTESEKWLGDERKPAPTDAVRLYCILGDIDQDPDMYEKAWEFSNHRSFRAQKSLGRYWYGKKDYVKASLAFSKAVKLRQLDHATWFALGCALLELNQFQKAVEVFSRAIQLDDGDAESWSNLAISLLNLDNKDKEKVDTDTNEESQIDETGDPPLKDENQTIDSQKNRKDALNALKQAAKLKRENYRIWDNLLTVAASINPPSYVDIVNAQTRIIELRGSIDGEKCIDESILENLVNYATRSPITADSQITGLSRMVCQLIDLSIARLITSSARLWTIVAKLALWRNRPSTALEAEEKAWRIVTQQPGWEHSTEAQWNKVVDATIRLTDAYRELGPREKTEGMASGSGELVKKDWAFKSRTAVRGILGRGKESWEDTEGWHKLKAVSTTSQT